MTSVSEWRHAKTEVVAKRGVVVARHPLSALAGQEILAKGGNAVDAAVTASLVGSVVQPVANAIGGGGLMLIAQKGDVSAINYLYQAPAGASPEMFELEAGAAPGLFGWSGIKGRANEIGGSAVGVPGSIAGLHHAVSRYGRLSWAEVVAPAIAAAENGFQVDWYNSLMASVLADEMLAFPATARAFLRNGRDAYRPAVIGPADVHRQPELAEVLRKVATNGPSAFYQGEVARNIAAAVKAAGGTLGERDLAEYKVRTPAAARLEYRGASISYLPYGAPTFALALGILSAFDMPSFAPDDPQRLHLVVEALKLAWAYRDRFNGDSDVIPGPWRGLADPRFAVELAGSIDPRRAKAPDTSLDPYAFDEAVRGPDGAGRARSEGTVHISAADDSGGMVALTETVVGNFGSLVTSDDGVLLNNGMIAFSPIPGQTNSIAPGKRPATNMCPIIVHDASGRAVATLGASGGRKIIPAVLQALLHHLDHGLSMQDSIAHPRLDLEGDAVVLDARYGASVAEALERLGHRVERRSEDLTTFEFGNACGIARRDEELRSGVNPFQMTMAAGL